MYVIRKASGGFGFFVGMVYHGECGWHAGIQHKANIDDKEIVKYSTKQQADQQRMFLEEMFHEKNLVVVGGDSYGYQS